ncbi:MAG TPA: DUF402 domain-containing protein, partial [Bacillales bacterium]|nr:DUF402 domain-containing protein [Bacillales bacterium]
KRRRADRQDWQRIRKKSFHVDYLKTEKFTGHVSFLYLKEVSEPVWVENNQEYLCVADSNYLWVQHFPEGACHTQTAMFDAAGDAVQWYIDICKPYGIAEDGVPWFEDLYLDIVMNPDGDFQLLDADELEDALNRAEISREDYDLAWAEANQLVREIREGSFQLAELSEIHKKQYLTRERRRHGSD